MELTGNSFFFPWEVSLMEWLQAHTDGPVLSVISFFSAFGEEMILIVLLGFLYWWYDKKIGKNVGLSVMMGLVWNPMLKNIFLRRRPYFDHETIGIRRLVAPEADPLDIAAQGFSFPSGHSTNAVTAYGSLGLELRKKWLTAAALILPLLVGFSRMVVGAHYPTDVLVGWLLGAAAMLLTAFLREKIRNELVLDAILLATVIPGFFYCRSEDFYTCAGLMTGFMAGCLIEKKMVRFENTRSVLFGILRLLGGLAVYFLVSTVLKLPFSKEFLSSGSTAALCVRAGRYFAVALAEFGIYPLVFAPAERWLGKLLKKR